MLFERLTWYIKLDHPSRVSTVKIVSKAEPRLSNEVMP